MAVRRIFKRGVSNIGYELMPVEEIGDLMLITRNAVYKAVQTALEKLREMYYSDSMLKRWREAHWLVWDEIGE